MSTLIQGQSKNGISVPFKVDDFGHNVNIDLVHQKVHEGLSYTVNYLEKDVANNGFIRLLVRTGLRQAHILIEVEAEGKVYFKTFSNATVTADGTPPSTLITSKLTIFNRCGACGNGNKTNVFFGPTFTGGELRGNRMFPFGKGGTAVGGQQASRVESVVFTNSEFIIEVQNVSGQARDIGIVLDWYEV
jgi:hypothetical protein